MSIIAPVRVDRRFSRSARIDSDMGRSEAIEGYVLQPSVRQAFTAMAQSVQLGRQGAFSWTGPYGGGKSSTALVLGALLSAPGAARSAAEAALGPETTDVIAKSFGRTRRGWGVIALSGRRSAIAEDLRAALSLSKDADVMPRSRHGRRKKDQTVSS